MRSTIFATTVTCLAAHLLAASALAQSKAEIQAMDKNGDGVVTRAEWQGERGAFRLHDTNKDDMLSGTEVWDAGSRSRARANQDFSDWTDQRFAVIDSDRDGRIVRREWQFDRAVFDAADANRDGALSRAEFRSQRRTATANRADADTFRSFDIDGSGALTGNEWAASDADFRTLDRNRDGLISRDEFRETAGTSRAVNSQAYEAGYQRGQMEGRAAGRGDREHNQGWDLEGQRELETADSGYVASIGAKADYQAGYRAGFRVAYAEGFGPR
jgi:Ca2+-binding EF-hand superfamily protein